MPTVLRQDILNLWATFSRHLHIWWAVCLYIEVNTSYSVGETTSSTSLLTFQFPTYYPSQYHFIILNLSFLKVLTFSLHICSIFIQKKKKWTSKSVIFGCIMQNMFFFCEILKPSCLVNIKLPAISTELLIASLQNAWLLHRSVLV